MHLYWQEDTTTNKDSKETPLNEDAREEDPDTLTQNNNGKFNEYHPITQMPFLFHYITNPMFINTIECFTL